MRTANNLGVIMNFQNEMHKLNTAEKNYQSYISHYQTFLKTMASVLNSDHLKSIINIKVEDLEKIEFSFAGQDFLISSDVKSKSLSKPLKVFCSRCVPIEIAPYKKLEDIGTLYINSNGAVAETIDQSGQFIVSEGSECGKCFVSWLAKYVSA
jgi:hypothetical protein